MANLTPHNNANYGDFAKTVIMPGDPKRAELIATKYLTDAKLVTDVRGILGYTGTYKGKRISVMASGMGMPSMGIYSYELFKVFDVDKIIRIGSCGSYTEDLYLLDLILVDKTYTEGNYALAMNNENIHICEADLESNKLIEQTAKNLSIKYKKGTTLCSEVFDEYVTENSNIFERLPKDLNIIGAEMEAFALFYNAKVLGKKAACILTVVDDRFHNGIATSEEREKSLDNMILLSLNSAIQD
ncbi:MAG: purine-nucleoside phosphorylase [Clostridia bacterium]|nr:purine-nucleoside phosphorylase [Clostridia bacterium]